MASTSTRSNKVLLLHAPKDLRLETRPLAAPSSHEAQVAVRATGICGSDLHYYSDFRNGDFAVRAPLCLGHESAGTVVSVGSEVSNLKVGDRVALEVGIACRQCVLCKAGRYNLCKQMLFKSSAKTFPHADGTLAEYLNHPAYLCHKLPDNVTFEQGALVEPLSVSIHAFQRSKFPSNGSALVFGAGAIGLLTAAVLQAQGASTVVIADIDERRLPIALHLGLATKTFLIPRKPARSDIKATLADAQDLATAIGIAAGIDEFDRVYECTGVPSCVQTGIYAAKPGGKLVLVGMGSAIQTLPIAAAALREVDIVGVFRYAHTYPVALELLGTGKLPRVHELITHRRSLLHADEAFVLARNGKDEAGTPVIKVLIENHVDSSRL